MRCPIFVVEDHYGEVLGVLRPFWPNGLLYTWFGGLWGVFGRLLAIVLLGLHPMSQR